MAAEVASAITSQDDGGPKRMGEIKNIKKVTHVALPEPVSSPQKESKMEESKSFDIAEVADDHVDESMPATN